MIKAKVIKDSTTEQGDRLTTMVVKMPRFVLAQFNTHRQFSRNSASSRAIPIAKMIEQVEDDPVIPVYFGKNKPGMQAEEELKGSEYLYAIAEWKNAKDNAVASAAKLMALGVHKQIVNRLLELWMYTETIVTATNWANFYALRNHKDAQPEIKEVAQKMLEAHEASVPELLKEGQWHLPFINEEDWKNLTEIVDENPNSEFTLQKVSAARCARVSYLKHDGTKPSLKEDLALYDRLMGGEHKHASPTEHQARVPIEGVDRVTVDNSIFICKHESNLKNWIQFRKLIAGENITTYRGFTR